MIGCGQNVNVLYLSVGLGWDRSEEVGTVYLNWMICKGIIKYPNLVQTFTLLILVLHIYMNIDY